MRSFRSALLLLVWNSLNGGIPSTDASLFLTEQLNHVELSNTDNAHGRTNLRHRTLKNHTDSANETEALEPINAPPTNSTEKHHKNKHHNAADTETEKDTDTDKDTETGTKHHNKNKHHNATDTDTEKDTDTDKDTTDEEVETPQTNSSVVLITPKNHTKNHHKDKNNTIDDAPEIINPIKITDAPTVTPTLSYAPSTYENLIEEIAEEFEEGEIVIYDDELMEEVNEVEDIEIMEEIVEEVEAGNVTVDDEYFEEEMEEFLDLESEGAILENPATQPTFSPTSFQEIIEDLEELEKEEETGNITVDDDMLEDELEEVKDFEEFQAEMKLENPSSGPTTLVDEFEAFEEVEEIEELVEIEEEYEKGEIILDDDDVIETLEEIKEVTHPSGTNPETLLNDDDDDEPKEYVPKDDDAGITESNTDPYMNTLGETAKMNKLTIGLFVFAFASMVFTSYQVSENPDGAFASICRLCTSVFSFLCQIILIPFRKLFGRSTTHHPISAADYREPYRGTQSHFEIS